MTHPFCTTTDITLELSMKREMGLVEAFHLLDLRPIPERPKLLPGSLAKTSDLARRLRWVRGFLPQTRRCDNLLLFNAAAGIDGTIQWLDAHVDNDFAQAGTAWAERLYVTLSDAVGSGLDATTLFDELHKKKVVRAFLG
jgi:hypothetical protein